MGKAKVLVPFLSSAGTELAGLLPWLPPPQLLRISADGQLEGCVAQLEESLQWGMGNILKIHFLPPGS